MSCFCDKNCLYEEHALHKFQNVGVFYVFLQQVFCSVLLTGSSQLFVTEWQPRTQNEYPSGIPFITWNVSLWSFSPRGLICQLFGKANAFWLFSYTEPSVCILACDWGPRNYHSTAKTFSWKYKPKIWARHLWIRRKRCRCLWDGNCCGSCLVSYKYN